MSKMGRDILWVPSCLAGYYSYKTDKFILRTPTLLENLNIARIEGRLNKWRLEDKNWDIYEIDIPEIFINDFMRACDKGKKKKRKNKARVIFDLAEDMVGKIDYDLGYIEDLENYDDEGDDEDEKEDYEDDWWTRGEKWHEKWE